MHRFRILGPLAALVLLVLAPSVRADEFSDFRIPDHSAHLVSGSLSASSRGARYSETSYTSRDGREFGSLGLSGFWYRESDRRLLSAQVTSQFSGGHLYRSAVQTFPGAEHHSAAGQRDISEVLSVGVSWREYPWRVPVGIEAALQSAARWQHDWSRSTQTDIFSDTLGTAILESQSSRSFRTDNYFEQGSIALGLGRVRNAGGIYSARLLEQRLRDAGLLARGLSPQAAQQIARLFYAQPDFLTVHDRGEKYFWRELERILREDGALSERGMDAYSVLRALEPAFPGVSFFRPTGMFLSITVSGRHTHGLQRDDFSLSPPELRFLSSSDFERNLVLVGPRAEFHRPLGLRVQLDGTAFASFALKNDHVREGLEQATSLSGVWLVADRWFAQVRGSQARSYLKGDAPLYELGDDVWSTQIAGTLGYYLEDHVQVDLTMFDVQGEDHSAGTLFPGARRSSGRARSFELSLRYDFGGSLSAPGLYEPQGLMQAGTGP